MLRGLSLKEGNDLNVEYSSNGACHAPVGETVPASSGFVSLADVEKVCMKVIAICIAD